MKHNVSPYSLINELSDDDKRIPKLLKQIKKRGFDDSELWNLDVTIAKFVLPRLKRFKEIITSCPGTFEGDDDIEQWYTILDKIIFSMEKISQDNYSDPNLDIDKKVEEGLELFGKYFSALWD